MENEICICAAIKLEDKIWRGHRYGDAIHAMREELSFNHTGKELIDWCNKEGIEPVIISYDKKMEGRKIAIVEKINKIVDFLNNLKM